jgi:hypothetical protein
VSLLDEILLGKAAEAPPVEVPVPPVTYREFGDAVAMRQALLDNTLNAVSKSYPIENARYRLELHNPKYMDDKHYSLQDQKKAILQGQTLNWRLGGEWRLVDKASGQTMDKKSGVVAHVPYPTNRGTFIYRGSEYTVSNQMRLKPGVYTRQKENGILEAHFNTKPGTGPAFRLYMEPQTGIFRMGVGQSTLKLYPILRAMGVPDRDLEKSWGQELLAKNIEAEDPRAVSRAFAKLVASRAELGVADEGNAEKTAELEGGLLKLAWAEGEEYDLIPAGLIKLGASQLIATTAGVSDPSSYGSGHATPARALAELLTEQTRSPVEYLPFEWTKETGGFEPFGNQRFQQVSPAFEEAAKRKALLSAGFSSAEAYWRPSRLGMGTLPPAPTMMFMLDMPASSAHAATNYALQPHWYAHSPRPLIYWGPSSAVPNPETLRMDRLKEGLNIVGRTLSRDPITGQASLAAQAPKAYAALTAPNINLPVYNVGELSPAVAPNVLRMLEEPRLSREAWERQIYDLPNSPVPRGSLAGKQVVAISGSGRGDYVAARAGQLAEHLRREGASGNTAILAMAGSHPERGPLIREVLNRLAPESRQNLHVFGGVPHKEYVSMLRGPEGGAPFAHFGSSGASQFMESLLGGGKTMLPADLTELELQSNKYLESLMKDMPRESYKKLRDMTIDWMPTTHRGALQEWRRRGLALGNRPEDIMRLLRDPQAAADYQRAAIDSAVKVREAQRNTVALVQNLAEAAAEKGRFPHATGIFTPQTHPELFTRDPAVMAAAKQKALSWFARKVVGK